MLWEYSSSPNKYNVQFLLPPADELEKISSHITIPQETPLTAEEQQAVQKLCSYFLAEIGYSVTCHESRQVNQVFVENNECSLTIQAALDVMHSFAVCATLRDHSMRPLFLFNTLMLDMYKLTEH